MSTHNRRSIQRILSGVDERIFSILPDRVISNFRSPASENALLWNLVYPLAQPTISFQSLISIHPLWGTHNLGQEDDNLRPYYWGYSASGARMPGLDVILNEIDGPGNKTEIDLFLRGSKNLVVVEAKHRANFGRCSRYLQERCPEIHTHELHQPCRYWETGRQNFSEQLLFGGRPMAEDRPPPCNRHYQLARTLVVGKALAQELNLDFYLWLIVARNYWKNLEKTWLDFVDQVRDDQLWRKMRVIAWEEIRDLANT
ncbi:MAG: hypothetical protein IIC78_10485 [Chloroflexi bacterium]|nr:hypothetical protein [Chloroflexota bacterium]